MATQLAVNPRSPLESPSSRSKLLHGCLPLKLASYVRPSRRQASASSLPPAVLASTSAASSTLSDVVGPYCPRFSFHFRSNTGFSRDGLVPSSSTSLSSFSASSSWSYATPLSCPSISLLRCRQTLPPRCLAVSCCTANVAPILMDERARIGEVMRKTKETDVKVSINLDGTGICQSNTGIPFLDHMLDQIASHGLFDVNVMAKGDLHIDDHHTNEDIALALGTDLSGRPFLAYDMDIPTERVGTYDTQLVEHFFQSLVNTSGMTLHIRKLSGKNSHHIIEACFKAFARALRKAIEYDERRMGSIPSSKGVLSRA